MFEGTHNFGDDVPINFDYQDELQELYRQSNDEDGFNEVCLLPNAYNEMTTAECMKINPQPIEDVVSDKSRRDPTIDVDVPSNEYSKQPYYAEGCMMPKYFCRRTTPGCAARRCFATFWHVSSKQ